ncbi:MAG: sigma-54-dependent Fis family transcriptional regulator, partial [Deltaproteobacteria bacterium]|nr:sigma-54-dependent Fis family transcriptional regulator [Deltaproteobacteria bacterium]
QDFREAKALFEREYLEKKLAEHQGNVKKTAQAIGIERRHLHRKIKSLGLAT